LLSSGQELNWCFPQLEDPEKYAMLDFQYFFLQPMDAPNCEVNMRLALDMFCPIRNGG